MEKEQELSRANEKISLLNKSGTLDELDTTADDVLESLESPIEILTNMIGKIHKGEASNHEIKENLLVGHTASF